MKNINEIALAKKEEYDRRYVEWCQDNPGSIMNGLSSMAMGAELASHCDTEEELKALHKVYLKKAKSMKGVHGFHFLTTALNEILTDFNNQ